MLIRRPCCFKLAICKSWINDGTSLDGGPPQCRNTPLQIIDNARHTLALGRVR